MKLSEKLQPVVSKLEILVAVVMFFVMLVSCGLYINIKLNGKTSNLPRLSENDKKMLLRSSVSDSITYTDDLLEPVFLGIKKDNNMLAILPSDEHRRSVEEKIYDIVAQLFKGESTGVEFNSSQVLEDYIGKIKQRTDYILVGFYGDLPSSVILPCMLDNYRVEDYNDVFLFRYLYLLADDNGNLYGCAVSEDNTVTELYPKQTIRFDKILNESYDISEGWSEFEYSEYGLVNPVLLSSFTMPEYKIDSFASIYGKDDKQMWIKTLFDVFSLNANLVRSFTSGDNTEINYVEEFCELIVNDSGVVEFKSGDNGGAELDEYLGNVTGISGFDVSLADKIFALKRIINRIRGENSGVSYTIAGIDYDREIDSLKVYFKYLTDGIFLYNTPYDAVFEITDNELVYACFKAIICSYADSQNTVIPQKYVSVVSGNGSGDGNTVLALSDSDINGVRTARWVDSPAFTEVNE